jgi:hypothetical protein
MSYFEDLSDYTYHDSYFYRPETKNVGWLDAAHEFPKSVPTEEALDLVWAYCKISVAQMRGIHDCELCPPATSHYVKRNEEPLLLGSAEMRVFGRDGTIYAAPTLIYHYISVHHYKPPDEFLSALREGPKPPNSEYFDRLTELGLEWNPTSAPATKPTRFKDVRVPGGWWKREIIG